MAGFPPLTQQGNLNRIITQITVAGNTALNVDASYMAKGQAVMTFEGPFTDQIGTATSIVNSPLPYVFGQIVINLLRSQSLWNVWLAQAQVNTFLGNVVAWPDSTSMAPITLTQTSITNVDPGAFDGVDPAARVTVRGTFTVNASLWASLTGTNAS